MLSRLSIDRRYLAMDGSAPDRITFTKDRRSVAVPTGISVLPSQWDGTKVVGRPDRAALNAHLTRSRTETDAALLRIMERPDWPDLSAYQVRDLILGKEPVRRDLLMPRLLAWADGKANAGTRGVYMQTYRRILAFDPDAARLAFSDITVDWLTRFDAFMARTSPSRNARNIHLRNIRTVFNDAIDDEVTTFYPFRRFRIRPEATAKRSLSVENLRLLFGYPVEEYARIHLDMFRLMFFLMGINIVDLYGLKEITPDGRVEFNRAKTHRFYSMRVEPEAMEIIGRYRGKKNLLCMADHYSDYRDYAHHINDALKRIGPVTRSGLGGRKTVEPLFPHLSTYWARHSWATIAASLDIPKETIAAGLGHGGNTVTDIYIDFDRRKVDEANRKVIDWVLYGIKGEMRAGSGAGPTDSGVKF